MKKFNAFTLAEVLITLGIIGVVAAMTMPTLINQTNGAQYKAAYKKALSAISQGVTLNVALEDESFAEGGAYDILKNRMNIVSKVDGRGYTIKRENTSYASTGDNTSLFFNDSSMFEFVKAKTSCTEADKCVGLIDVNGKKGPNKITTNPEKPDDVYSVYYYDQTILPMSETGKQVLYAK